MSLFDKFIPDRRVLQQHLGPSRAPTHPFREAVVNIAFAGLAAFAIVGSAACAIKIVFNN